MQLSPEQENAAKAVKKWLSDPKRKPFFYLAGYAGTGKTTLAKVLAENVANARYAAFTGKAALVLASKGCTPSTTIHSLIYKTKTDENGKRRFVLNWDSAIKRCDLLIVDEISMVNEILGRDLLKFGVPILVLGDPAQLPPVKGTGYFTSGKPDFMLTEIHRQARDNPIIRMSMIVREGNGELEFGKYGDSVVMPRREMTASHALDSDILITGMNNTRRQWNGRIRDLTGRKGRFVVGERVISLKNSIESGLLNGALWNVTEIIDTDGDTSSLALEPVDAFMEGIAPEITTHKIFLERDDKAIPNWMKQEFDPVDYGYVVSCHKAQGSQWDSTLIYDESSVFRENAARWLYTAITRAAQRTIIVR